MASEVECNEMTYTLDVENELRFTVPENSPGVTLELLNGLAEMFGSELYRNKVYNFPPSASVSIFTWQGCTVKVTGETEGLCSTKDTLMMIPVNLHACLEELRIQAETEDSRGPIALVAGPTDVGKSTLCQILLNYASRLGRRPLFIDLDVGQGSSSMPGSVTILPVEKPADIVEGFNQDSLSVHFFGYKSPGHNIVLYLLMLKKLGITLHSRMRDGNRNSRLSGVIINTCGWVRGHGYHAITLAALAFEIDVLFVLEEESLYTQLKNDMPSCVKVVFIPKAFGVIERSRYLRIKTREDRVREYFYGPRENLHPHKFEVKFVDIMIFKVHSLLGDGGYYNSVEVNPQNIKVERICLGPHLMFQVLGLSYADDVKDDFVFMNIIGFVCIVDISMDYGTITFMSPQPGPLPKKILLMGDIKLKEKNRDQNSSDY